MAKRIYFEKILSQDDFNEAEVEYLLLLEYWGMGYGSEILR